jgi:hypothetical protein
MKLCKDCKHHYVSNNPPKDSPIKFVPAHICTREGFNIERKIDPITGSMTTHLKDVLSCDYNKGDCDKYIKKTILFKTKQWLNLDK